MNTRIFLMMICLLFIGLNSSLCIVGAEAIEIEIFQKNAIKSAGEYETASNFMVNALRQGLKDDNAIIATVAKMKREGVSVLEVTGYINTLRLDSYSYEKTSKFPKQRTSIRTQHDLTIGGGACAWILEQILDCKFPPVTTSTTTETLKTIQASAQARLKEICSQSLVEEDPTKTVDVSRHNLGEKLKLASDPATSPVTLDKLARDEDVDVRRAAVKNPNTATATLKNLSGDRRVLLGKSERQDDPTLSVQAVAGSHPKMLNHFSDGNFLFLREKKKDHR